MAARLREHYIKRVIPALTPGIQVRQPDGGTENRKDLNQHRYGRSDAECEAGGHRPAMELGSIAGQKPVVCKAKKSVAAFKVREGMPIGVAVTLRGDPMFEFLDRLMNVALPRVRNFRVYRTNRSTAGVTTRWA